MNRKKDILQLYNQLFQFLFILKNMWGRYYIAAIKKGLYINILFFTLIYLYGCDSKIKKIQPFILPFSKVTKSVDVAFQGIQLLCTDTAIKLKIIRSGFNYLNTHFGNTISFDIGLASLSLYYATGETKYLEQAKETAALLDSLVLKNGLIPEYYLNKKVNPNSILYPGTWGQSNTLCFICALSEIDSSYKTLCKKLADGLLTYGLNHKNNLAYFQVYAISGQPYNSKEFGYESQLGSSSCAISQSLLFVYKLFPTEKKYLNESLKILKSIWNLRDRETNLISECYDVYNNKKAERLYPANQFRYDDMGGSYIRALTFAYQISGDKEIQAILNQYIEALLKYTWDERLGGGAFRYLSDVTGHGTPQVETMYGLFIASLIESSQYVNNNIKKVIIEKCSEHADNIYLTDFGVKNFMIPHNISQDGRYTAKTNDSQLAYAVIQFPLGMSLLTQATNNYNYIYIEQIVL